MIYLETTLPIEPHAKGRPRFARTKRGVMTRTPRKTKAWEDMAALYLRAAYFGEPIDEPLRLEVDFVARRVQRLPKREPSRHLRPRKPDVDNECKSLLEALEKAGVVANDSRICVLVARQWYAAIGEEPCVEVILSSVSPIQSLNTP